MKNLMIFGILMLALIAIPAYAVTLPLDEPGKVNLYFFYSLTCPHCQAEHPVLQEFEAKYPELKVHYLEASKNQDLFRQASDAYQTTTAAVPRTYLPNIAFIGYSEQDMKLQYSSQYKAYGGSKNLIESAIVDAIKNLNNPVPGNATNNDDVKAPTEFPSWIIYVLILIAVIVILLLIFLPKGKKKKKKEIIKKE